MLKNIGNVTLAGPFTVTDDKVTVTCPASASLAVGASITCNASYTVTQADLDFGLITNTATGHAKTLGGTPVNSNAASATVNAVWKPALTLAKTATPQTYSKVGDIISYSYLLTNSGNVWLKAPFAVTDNKVAVTCPAAPIWLAPGRSITCTASYTITQADLDAGSVKNTAQGHGLFNWNRSTQTTTMKR